MRRRSWRRSSALALTAIGMFSLTGLGLTAANVVVTSKADDGSTSVTANQLKPAACAGLNLVSVLIGVDGDAQANLVLGLPVGETRRGAGGNDCVLGGGGNDALQGGTGVDVCIGGPGTDTFNANCETQIQ